MVNTTRDPEKTRQVLLEAAFAEIHDVGFRAASLDRILSSTGVTKGALYHHFENKRELGYAVVDELIARWIRERWIQPLARPGNAIDVIKQTVRDVADWMIEEGNFTKGCPLNNLATEMSGIDDGFKERAEAVFRTWHRAFSYALERGRAQGDVREDIDPEDMGLFILSTLEGIQSILKNRPDMQLAQGQIRSFFLFLDGLRVTAYQAA